jgi:protease I
MQILKGKSVLLLAEDLYEDLELWYPYYRLIEEGASATIAAPEMKQYTGKNGYPLKPDTTIDNVSADQFDILVIPGGFAPDKLRRYDEVLRITQDFNNAGKVIAFICHAGWVPISAKILRGKHVTCVNAIRDDIENAGAIYHDEEVVVDGHIITSRRPPDLPAFCRAIIQYFSA